ncbi:hypothetical protein PENSPDRAFT_754710 [Peniophora sp. CONT]|nr:hypothetical protein PENSPDRAFT_754710 [Peniophora sp. CONT]
MGSCVSQHKSPDPDLEPESGKAGPGPIERLPDNVLYSVFLDVASAEPIYDIHGFGSSKSPNPSYHDCLGWTRLSAVCRRWRTILIGVASLWAECVFGLPADMAALALSRSGTAPLTVVIPTYVDSTPAWISQIMQRKKWGLPHTHRERLLNLALVHWHSHEPKEFLARDLSSQHYHMLFQKGLFNSLTLLILAYEYHDSGPSAPSREDLNDLRIVAPLVREVGFSPTLPIAYGDRPGLHLVLPALRTLRITTDLTLPTTIPTTMEQLHWIASLICSTLALKHLEIDMPIDEFEVDWAQIFGGTRGHLSALRTFKINGRSQTHLDQLLDLIVPDTPANISIILVLVRTDVLEALEPYVSIVGRSIRQRSLDSVYLSRWLLETTHPVTSIHIDAFPSSELLHWQTTLEAYLHRPLNQETTKAALWAACSSPSTGLHEAPPDESQHILDIVAPILIHKHNDIQTLILDQITTDQWDNAMREVMRSCLSGVTTLYCVHGPTDAFAKRPCTAALRLLCFRDTNEARTPSATHESLKLGRGDILPALDTVVVSMIVTQSTKGHSAPRSTANVSAWWNELIRALTYRRDVGLRVRVLRIVGYWATEQLRKRTVRLDTKMLARAGVLVDEVADERTVLSRPVSLIQKEPAPTIYWGS